MQQGARHQKGSQTLFPHVPGGANGRRLRPFVWRPFAPPLRDEAVAVNHSAVAVHHSGPPGLGPKGVVNRSIG